MATVATVAERERNISQSVTQSAVSRNSAATYNAMLSCRTTLSPTTAMTAKLIQLEA
jgi:hypothetical protein